MFLEATGDNGFAPTAAVVHPHTGDLFIAIGGRGTRAAVYRVHYRKAGPAHALSDKLTNPRQSLEDMRRFPERFIADAAWQAVIETRRYQRPADAFSVCESFARPAAVA